MILNNNNNNPIDALIELSCRRPEIDSKRESARFDTVDINLLRTTNASRAHGSHPNLKKWSVAEISSDSFVGRNGMYETKSILILLFLRIIKKS